MKRNKHMLRLLISSMVTASLLLPAGCSKSEAKTVMATVDDTNLYMDDCIYFIAYYEMYGQYQASYNAYYYGSSEFWDTQVDDSTTMRDYLKNMAYESAISMEILSDAATKADITLTQDQLDSAKDGAAEFLDYFSEDVVKNCGMTEEAIEATYQKQMLGQAYLDSITPSLGIDEDEIRSTFNVDDYKEYDTEYLFLPIYSYDSDMNAITPTEEEKASYKESMEAALEMVNSGTSFEDTKTAMADTVDLTYTTRDFLDTSTDVEQAYIDASKALDVDGISGVVEGDYGYYIIHLIDNTATTLYEQDVTDAIDDATNDALNSVYEELKANYTITKNEDAWDAIKMGTVTIEEDAATTSEEPVTTAE